MCVCVCVWCVYVRVCGALQCLEPHLLCAVFAVRGGVLRFVAVCCGALRCVAMCCSVLQCVAVCCSVCRVLQCVTVCCVRVAAAVCCSVLQCVAVCCVCLAVAGCRSVLQCVVCLWRFAVYKICVCGAL